MINLPQNEQIRTAINNYCQTKGVSKNELATQSGVSPATLSQIENRNWENINPKMWRKIWNKVNDANTTGLFTTADYTAAFNTCDSARNNRFMIGLIADTGIGKTTALTAYAMRKNVFYVCYGKSLKPKQFFILLLKEMGIAFEGTIHEMVNRIADELNTLDSPLVIIDEAGKINHTTLMYLHELHDKAIKNCGFVLAGMPYFKINLTKFSNKQKEGYSEFLRRIRLWQVLDGLSRKEVAFICESNAITDPATIKEFQQYKRFGDLQNAILLYNIENAETL